MQMPWQLKLRFYKTTPISAARSIVPLSLLLVGEEEGLENVPQKAYC